MQLGLQYHATNQETKLLKKDLSKEKTDLRKLEEINLN